MRKGQRRFQGFDDKILALYSRGLSTRDIEAHLAEIYGVNVGRDLISRVTDAVMEDVRRGSSGRWMTSTRWSSSTRSSSRSARAARCNAGPATSPGVTVEGDRDVLGMWFQETEGAKFWMQVLTDLKQRGVRTSYLLRRRAQGLPGGDRGDLPETVVQTCIVHLIRHSLKYVPRREREQVARDLKPIYTAVDADAAQAALEAFDEQWGIALPGDHPGLAERLGARDPVPRVPARGAPRDLHNERDRSAQPAAAQSNQDQRTLPQRGGRPKLIYLAITNAVPAWTRTRNWTAALLAFKIHFGDRLPD